MQSSNPASGEPPNQKRAIWRKGPRGYLVANQTTPGESGHGQIGLGIFGGESRYEPEFSSDEVFINNNGSEGSRTSAKKRQFGTNERQKKLFEEFN